MIFLTGATGYLGRELLVRLLVAEPDRDLYLLVRPDGPTSAEERIREILDSTFDRSRVESFLPRIRIIEGDVALENFGIGDSRFHELAKNVHSIYHCAALTPLNSPLEPARKINVGGTQEVVKFAELATQLNDRFFRFNHVSTAYVAGNVERTVRPDELPAQDNFRNAYERSKAEAEVVVRAAATRVPTRIYRPSVVVGDSVTGQTSAFNVIYVPARLLIKGLLTSVPGYPETPFDIVPVDYVADAIVYLSQIEERLSQLQSFHIATGVGRESTPLEILELLFRSFNNYRTKKGRNFLATPPFITPERFAQILVSVSAARTSMRYIEKAVAAKLGHVAEALPFIPYMESNPRFDTSETDRALVEVLSPAPLFSHYAERVFRYCFETNWGKVPWTNPGNFRTIEHRLFGGVAEHSPQKI